MPDLSLRFASGLYDRMTALFTGEVRPEGVDLQFVVSDSPTALFGKMLAGEFDAAEMSMAHFVRLMSAGDSPLVGIPVFPSRVFRHGCIVVQRDAGIAVPRDIEGKRVGVPDFAMTAAVWIRGILESEYGVDWSTIRWVQDPAPERSATSAATLAARSFAAPVEENHSGKPLATLVQEGALDALIGADIPEPLRHDPRVVRLFPDYREVEREYFRRTGIFPVMHTVVLRRELHERHPFLARSLFDALERSKRVALEKMRYMGTLRYMVPWLIADVEEVDELFGGDAWPYGLEPNRPALEAFVSYMAGQSLIDRPVEIASLFVPV